MRTQICTRVFSTLISWSWQARVCMRVFSILMSWSNENKSCIRLDESWQARVCIRVFLTLVFWSNENMSNIGADELTREFFESFLNSHVLVRVDKWEFSTLIHKLQPSGSTHMSWMLLLFMQTITMLLFFDRMLFQTVVNAVRNLQIEFLVSNISRSKTGRELNTRDDTRWWTA